MKNNIPNDFNFEKHVYEKIFNILDTDNDGTVEINTLADHLFQIGMKDLSAKIASLPKMESNDMISLEEFLAFSHFQDRCFWLVYQIVKNKSDDSSCDPVDIKQTFNRFGMYVDNEHCELIKQRLLMDKSKVHENGPSCDGFRATYPAPSTSLSEALRVWRRHLMVDVGEGLVVPVIKPENSHDSIPLFKQLVAGGLAGIVSRTFTAPLDRLKTVLQAHSGKATCSHRAMAHLKNLIKEGGVGSMWRGNGINCLKVTPESALRFTIYDYAKMKFAKDPRNCCFHERLLAGSIAGLTSQIVIYPLEVMKTYLALSDSKQHGSIAETIRRIYRFGGVSNFYRGILPSLFGVIPYAAIDLSIYESLKIGWLKYSNSHTSDSSFSSLPSVPLLLSCGALSSSCGQLATYPFVVIKTKLQSSTLHPNCQKMTISEICKQIYQNTGIRGFYSGMHVNFMKTIPSVSLSYLIYELVKDSLHVAS